MYNMCYLSKLPVEPAYYLQVTNTIDLEIYFILQYTSAKGTKTKQSPVLGKGAAAKLSFIYSSRNIAFNVLAAHTHDFICNHTLPYSRSYYFSVIQTPHGISCVES